jgi:hypothetical protein
LQGLVRNSAFYQEIAMAYKRPSEHASQKAAVAPKSPPPLGSVDLTLFRSVLGVIAPEWTVELQGFCADEASLIVVPDSGEDSAGPSFAVTREGYGFKLDRVRWDLVTEVGLYPSLTDVLAAIRCQIALCLGSSDDGPVTIH